MYTNITTSYDILNSSIKMNSLIPILKNQNINNVGITGSSMNGYITIMNELKSAQIKGCFGLKLKVNGNEITAYASNEAGYYNLVKLSSAAALKTLTFEILLAHQTGVIFVIPIESSFDWIHQTKQLGSLCIGVQRVLGQKHPNEAHLSTWQIPVIISHDMNYISHEDAFSFKVLRAIAHGEVLQSLEVPQATQNVLPISQIKSLYSDQPQWIHNTEKFLLSCEAYIPPNEPKMPTFPIQSGENHAVYFRNLAMERLKLKKIEEEKKHVYYERLQYELEVICSMGYEDYFLIVADFMEFARNNGILTGPGRGSSASSLVAYVLGITQVDPLLYDLVFERFLNPSRVSLPDIDIDFIDSRREEVIQYVAKKYGKPHVVRINTMGTLSAKAVSRDVGRMFKFPTSILDKVSKMITASKKENLAAVFDKSKDFQAFVNESSINKLWYDTCLRLEGLPRNESTHAAGVILAPMDFTEVAPISRENDGIYCSQWTMQELESIGLLKIDFLGLRNLGLLEDILHSVESTYNVSLPLETMPLNNAATFRLLQKGQTEGIFQLESKGMQETLKQVIPTRFEDIIAINALYRPGPMEFIPHYADRKKGAPYEIIEVLKPILGETYNIIVYQEQILKIAQIFAGFSLAEADLLRRAISKKKREILEEQEKLFVKGAVLQGYSEKLALEVYELILKFAEYGFPKSHAAAYSIITYQLAYFKANYPAHFYACMLNQAQGNPDKVKRILDEVKARKIPVVMPTYPTASYKSQAKQGALHLGYNIIRNVSAPNLEALMSLPIQTDLFEMGKALGDKMDETMFRNMIAVGVFDKAFNQPRRKLLASLTSARSNSELGLDLGFVIIGYQDDASINVMEAERKAVGFYLSDHPIAALRKTIDYTSTIGELKANQEVRIIGMIDSIRETNTKTKQKMAFVTISDEESTTSLTLFSNVYNSVQDQLKKDEIVFVTGVTEYRNGKIQVKASKVLIK